MTRAKAKAKQQRVLPPMDRSNATTLGITLDDVFNATMAEVAKTLGTRTDMIYEMFQFSQYADGSVLNCYDTKQGRAAETYGDWISTYTAQEIVDGKLQIVDNEYKPATWLMDDLKRNAEAAIKNGTTKNLAPVVGMTVKGI